MLFGMTEKDFPREVMDAERALIKKRLERQMQLKVSVLRIGKKLRYNFIAAGALNLARSFDRKKFPEMFARVAESMLGAGGEILYGPGAKRGRSFTFNGVAGCILQGERETQQDRYQIGSGLIFDKPAAVTAVFDGHGGSLMAEYCEKNVVDALFKRLEEQNSPFWTDLGVYNALKLVLADLSLGFALEEKLGGTTANLVLEIDNKLWCVNAGDSRAFLLTSSHEVVSLSFDAKLVPGEFKKAEARGAKWSIDHNSVFRQHHPLLPPNYGINMATALGDHFFGAVVSPRGKIVCVERPKTGWIVQFTDGVEFSNAEVAEMLLEYLAAYPLQEAVLRLATASQKVGNGDNVTILVRPLK